MIKKQSKTFQIRRNKYKLEYIENETTKNISFYLNNKLIFTVDKENFDEIVTEFERFQELISEPSQDTIKAMQETFNRDINCFNNADELFESLENDE